MSAGFEAWARSQNLDALGWAHARHAALERLASEANHEGIAILKMEDLARSIGRSMREARRLVSQLESGRFIQRITRKIPRQAENAYRLLTHWVMAQIERSKAPAADLQPATAAAAQVQVPRPSEVTIPPDEPEPPPLPSFMDLFQRRAGA